MSDDLPPPLPRSGYGGWFLGALAMLGLAGGLVVWRLSASSGERPAPPPPAPPPPVTTTAAPVFDRPPPPPPPPEEPAASAARPSSPAGTPAAGAAAAPAGTCGPTCEGQAGAQLQSALRSRGGQARACYERALRQNPMLQGKMTVNVRIGSAGQVCSLQVQNGLGDPSVASCVTASFRGGTYPVPQGGCVDAQVPLNFVPK